MKSNNDKSGTNTLFDEIRNQNFNTVNKNSIKRKNIFGGMLGVLVITILASIIYFIIKFLICL